MNERPLIGSDREQILSLPAETQYAPNGIVSRTLLRTATLRTVLFGFAEGQELTEHTSTQQALIQILSGECEFTFAGRPHSMTAGDFLYLPPNVPHAVKATRQFSMLLILSKPTQPSEPAPNPPASLASQRELSTP
jgi:quercetin dioxygenase-like cupin family protein